MITEAKRLVEAVIRKRTPIRDIAYRKTDEDTLCSRKTLPYASLFTADGTFDERTAKCLKVKNEDGTLAKIQVRGSRKVPIEVRITAKSEADSDKFLGDVLRYLPMKWALGSYQGTINIMSEHHDDYSSNAADRSMASAFLEFAIEVGSDPVPIEQIGGLEVVPE